LIKFSRGVVHKERERICLAGSKNAGSERGTEWATGSQGHVFRA